MYAKNLLLQIKVAYNRSMAELSYNNKYDYARDLIEVHVWPGKKPGRLVNASAMHNIHRKRSLNGNYFIVMLRGWHQSRSVKMLIDREI